MQFSENLSNGARVERKHLRKKSNIFAFFDLIPMNKLNEKLNFTSAFYKPKQRIFSYRNCQNTLESYQCTEEISEFPSITKMLTIDVSNRDDHVCLYRINKIS